MGITEARDDQGIAEIVVDVPPVNALTVAGWFELAEKITAAGKDPATRVVVLRSEGKGFNAGVDIKEMQNTEGFAALIGANKGCFAAFAAVYDCPVPLIAAVNGFCVGGGIGLAGNADIVIASDDAFFGLPEVDRGALGAATHLARLVPAAQDAGDGLHRRHRDRRGAARVRLRPARRARATSCAPPRSRWRPTSRRSRPR